jgi:hypothetical protein
MMGLVVSRKFLVIARFTFLTNSLFLPPTSQLQIEIQEGHRAARPLGGPM